MRKGSPQSAKAIRIGIMTPRRVASSDHHECINDDNDEDGQEDATHHAINQLRPELLALSQHLLDFPQTINGIVCTSKLFGLSVEFHGGAFEQASDFGSSRMVHTSQSANRTIA